jgi:pSer/pThr/pTyr-binding forkhead associated (FHA) protein
VETTKSKEVKLYQLLPDLPGQKIKGSILSKGRILVGRTESCEIVIPSGAISAVHAVFEITPNGAKVYDMNSKNGTFINDERIVAKNLSVGDKVKFGNISFTFKEYTEPSTLPPVLETLEPRSGKASTIPTIPDILPPDPVQLPSAPAHVVDEGPYIVYPLGADAKADYSEYIFEDVEELVPIFKYDHGKQAVEIIILFNDKVYSVDYLPENNGVYSIVGAKPSKNEMEFAYLGKDEKVPFIEISNGNCIVHKLHNYTTQHLSDEKILDIADGRVNIQSDDIVRLENGHLEIYVRKVSSPPKVKPAPFFRRDQGLKKYMLLVLFFVFLPLSVLSLFKDVEKEKEKDPDRIARILYKKPIKKITMKVVKPKSKTKPKPMKKKPKKPSKKKVAKEAKKTPKKTVKKVTKKTPGVKTAKKVVTQKKVKKPAPKSTPKPAKVVAKSASKTPKKSTSTPRKSVRPSPKIGAVDTYKSFDFKSTISSTMAKGGSLRGAKVAKSQASSAIGTTSVGGGVATNLRKADVGTDVGSLTGSTVGKLTQSKGTEGLSAKTGIYTAGIPSETVVLGSMDPDVIRRILREHIPQFRYCYQKELDRKAGRDVSGTIGLVFTIGASGSVSKAGVDQSSNLPGTVKQCVVRVLKGIRFPRPLGGGKVDVKQPFNFMPKRI